MLATGISAQYAFMLPVATPSNAVAFSYGRVSVMDMVRTNPIPIPIMNYELNCTEVNCAKLIPTNYKFNYNY